ncbi:cupin domain-containing protein [Spirillospora sp. NPDC048819]|uniref:cupin domain-containing protein n=1 Tax=Spirillospora sp. NPDC048819 TaxID=3155268 RepID=UPI0033C1D5A0
MSHISAAVGSHLVYEDSRVRVWTLELAPGEETPVHQHLCDYVYVVISGGSTETRYAGGSADPRTDRAGESYHHPAGPPHSLANTGGAPYRNIIVELVETGGQGE